MAENRRPEAFWFGRAHASCFGMLQAPPVASDRGVLFCNTLGFDGLLADRVFRRLAGDLADRGFWTMRFDYDGEGDSAGGPWEPDRLAAWFESIDAAVNVLRSRGVSDVRIVGFRAGASLAHLYTTTHPEISGVALWWPCVTGSTYVRELRALSRLSAAARPVQRVTAPRFPSDSLEVCGFEFAAPALAELAAIDLAAVAPRIHPPPVLLIDRIDAPPSIELVSKLVESGSHVDHERMAGYSEFMTDDEVDSTVPEPVLARISEWLDGSTARVPDDDALAALELGTLETRTLAIDEPTAGRYAPLGPARDDVVEEPAWVGDRLFAIISSPAGNAPTRDATIVLYNAGLSSRVGPGRLYVNLARYWASLGFTVVRVDLGGAGDSTGAAPSTGNEPYAPIRVDEVGETIEWVRNRTGNTSVVGFGMCSGAFNAFHAALDGYDINHAILVNPAMFYLGADATASSSAEARLWAAHTLRRGVMNPRKWRLALKEPDVFKRSLKRARDLLRAGASDGARFAIGAAVRNTARRVGFHMKARSPLSRDLEVITARGVKVLMIFAAGEAVTQYVRAFAGPGFETLLRAGQVNLIEVDGGDHVFSAPGARQRLFEETTQYLEREYPLPLIPEAAAVSDRGHTRPYAGE